MILAAIEGQLVLVVVMAAIGFVNWIASKLKSPPPPPPAPGAKPVRRPAPDSEEERMRRFLEALGIPGNAPPSRQPNPPTVPPPQPPALLPAHGPRRSKSVPRPSAKPAQRPFIEEPAFRARAGEVQTSELVTPPLPDFDTVAAKISAIPMEATAALAFPSTADEASLNALLRKALSSPRELRTAFILREVLGPPPGLQR